MTKYTKTEAGTFKLADEREFNTALAAGVAASWQVPEIRADRAKPVVSVKVGGKTYDSFPKAWREANAADADGTGFRTASQIQKNRKALFAAKDLKAKLSDGRTYEVVTA